MSIEKKNEEGNRKKLVFRPDLRQRKIVVKAARLGSINAVRASRVLGLDITYIKDGVLVTEKPDGGVVKTPLDKTVVPDNAYKLTKGMILYAKR